jgi:hypothetical protein
MSKRNIDIQCHLYDCYWNLGAQFLLEGNCSAKKVTITVDYGLCSTFIDRTEAQARLANAAFEAMAKTELSHNATKQSSAKTGGDF